MTCYTYNFKGALAAGQHRLPDAAIRRGLGIVVVAVGAVFLALGLS